MATVGRVVFAGLVGALTLGAVAAAIDPVIARACGGFYSGKRPGAERPPSLAYEQVVIVHDAANNREHFIREVAFRRADEPFGFVVPTPSRPEVASFDKSVIKLFGLDFPFAPPPGLGLIGSGYGSGSGAGFGGRGVTVLAQSKVGSFTAFVLAADDSEALSRWLTEHGLVTTEPSEAWLAHYVAMKFYYVAMRYDPPAGGRKGTATSEAPVMSETMRISFDTPVPYYPYLEPATPPGIGDDERVLDLWVVGSRKVTPVAVREQAQERTWIRPLREGEAHPAARERLSAFGPELEALLPEGELVVQTFQDQKRSRAGIGDILFVPAQPEPISPEDRAALQPLLAVLDPALAGTGSGVP